MKKRKLVIPDRFRKAGTGLLVFAVIELVIKAFEIMLAWGCENKTVAILLMLLFSFVLRYLIILIYDHIEGDWFLIELFKQRLEQKKEAGKHTSVTRKILKLKKIGNWFLLIGLICFNPVVTVLYYREGNHKWDGVPPKALGLFTISVISSTTALAGAVYLISKLIEIIKMIFY